MAAPQPNNNRRETVDFPPNIPVTVALVYSEPRMVAGHKGERFMYTTTEGARFFVDPPVAAQIAELGVNVREPFTITRKSASKKGTPDTWEVARIAAPAGEQPDGTFAVPKLPDAPAPKPPQRAETAARCTTLVDSANDLIDGYAEVLKHAAQHPGIRPDDVRSIFLSAFINLSQKTGKYAA